MGVEGSDEERTQEQAEIALQDLQRVRREAQVHLIQGIIYAREVDGLTYRQIGAALGIAHGWCFKLYKRGKKQGL